MRYRAHEPAPPLVLELVDEKATVLNKSVPIPVFDPKLVIVFVATVVKESFLPIPRIWKFTTPLGLPNSRIECLWLRMSVLILDIGSNGDMYD